MRIRVLGDLLRGQYEKDCGILMLVDIIKEHIFVVFEHSREDVWCGARVF
jgi:hypothetical protein